jgi:hypothetical protein
MGFAIETTRAISNLKIPRITPELRRSRKIIGYEPIGTTGFLDFVQRPVFYTAQGPVIEVSCFW